jgi:hypothetical protein
MKQAQARTMMTPEHAYSEIEKLCSRGVCFVWVDQRGNKDCQGIYPKGSLGCSRYSWSGGFANRD